MSIGQSVQLTATAILSNGDSRSVTTEATWQSTNAVVDIVSPSGLATAQSTGFVEIRATYVGKSGSLKRKDSTYLRGNLFTSASATAEPS
jgi:hypothetical protein